MCAHETFEEEASVIVDAILVDTGEEMPQDHEKLVEFFRQTSFLPVSHTHLPTIL